MPLTRRSFLTLSLPMLGIAPLRAESSGKAPQLRFGVIADPQYVDAPEKGSPHYRASLAKLEACIAELNQHDLAFTITLGDLIDRDFKSFDPVLERYAKLKSPHRIVPGNHDFAVADADRPRVMEKLGLQSGHQSFSHGNWRFIVIDGTEISPYRYQENDPRTAEAIKLLETLKAQGHNNAQSWNGAVSDTQLQWLENELSTAKQTYQRVIICGHFPLLPANDSHRLWNAETVAKVIARHPHVAAYLNGHNHKGNYAQAGTCHYVNFKGMVETASDNPFAIVTCYEDHLTIEGFGPEPSRQKLS